MAMLFMGTGFLAGALTGVFFAVDVTGIFFVPTGWATIVKVLIGY
jgi:hypothetical protein